MKLPSLEHRRRRGDLIEVFKCLSGLNQTDRPLFKLHFWRDTRGHSLKLAKQRCSKEVRRVSFTQRVVSTWNKLPEYVVRAPTVNAFKTDSTSIGKTIQVSMTFTATVSKY